MESILQMEENGQTSEQLVAMVHFLLRKSLYTWQRDAALALHFGVNVICSVGTGKGKSLAFPCLMLLVKEGDIAWIILPLNQL